MDPSSSSSSSSPYHSGPFYGFVPSGTYMDKGCYTEDTGRGGCFITWTDLFGCVHRVDFSSNPSSGKCTVCFPISYGGNWKWQDANAIIGK